jgi:hypothetical protein
MKSALPAQASPARPGGAGRGLCEGRAARGRGKLDLEVLRAPAERVGVDRVEHGGEARAERPRRVVVRHAEVELELRARRRSRRRSRGGRRPPGAGPRRTRRRGFGCWHRAPAWSTCVSIYRSIDRSINEPINLSISIAFCLFLSISVCPRQSPAREGRTSSMRARRSARAGRASSSHANTRA